ncbi:MAG: PAS domain-containing sensor histidine kinase [Pseudomonadota bacterium]
MNDSLVSQSSRYQPLLQHAADNVMVMSASGDVVAMSPAARALHGLEPDEPAAMAADEYQRRFTLQDPDTRSPLDDHQRPVSRAHRGETVTDLALRLRGPRDSHRVACSVVPLAKRPPAEHYLVILRAPVGPRTPLAESERRLRTVIEALPVGLAFTDAAGRIILSNAALQRIWGGARYVGPDRYAQYKGWWAASGEPISSEEWGLARALAGERATGEIIEIETFDGEHKVIRNAALPLRNDQGRIIGALAVNEDISEHWWAEQQRERLAALVRSSTDAIIAKTTAGIITDWNPGAERMYGFTRTEAIGAPIAIIIPDDRPGEAEWLMELIRRGETLEQHETERVTRDGARLTVSLSLSPIRNALGRIVGAATISRDITERKRAERRLEAQAREREAADQRKDEFIAVLAHELRSPLAPIANGLTALRTLDTGGDRRELHDMMERQVDHMRRLLDDLLDASRMARGMLTVEKHPTDVNEVAEHAIEVTRAVLEQRDQDLQVTLGPEPLCVLGDHQRLVQVVVNLLHNAAKYTDPGGRIAITVRGHEQQVIVAVEDTGVGIPEHMLERVFHLFHNPEEATGHPKQGLGLGLTLVRSIVSAHGGTVRAESAGPGRGSEFTVTLPRLPERRAVSRE